MLIDEQGLTLAPTHPPESGRIQHWCVCQSLLLATFTCGVKAIKPVSLQYTMQLGCMIVQFSRYPGVKQVNV